MVCADDGLGAVAGVELGQYVRDVGLDGFRADDELCGDLGVRQALRDEAQDLRLALGQPGAVKSAGGNLGGCAACRQCADRGREEQ